MRLKHYYLLTSIFIVDVAWLQYPNSLITHITTLTIVVEADDAFSFMQLCYCLHLLFWWSDEILTRLINDVIYSLIEVMTEALFWLTDLIDICQRLCSEADTLD